MNYLKMDYNNKKEVWFINKLIKFVFYKVDGEAVDEGWTSIIKTLKQSVKWC